MSAPWEAFTKNKQWEEYLKTLLKTNDVALFRAIVLIYGNQTDEEQYAGVSISENKVGFTKYDAQELSSIAIKIKNKRPLSKTEVAVARSKMPKYWRQLMVISKQRMAARTALEAEIRKELQTLTLQPDRRALTKCSEEGVACEHGICSECEQMRFSLE